jgi:protein SCO1
MNKWWLPLFLALGPALAGCGGASGTAPPLAGARIGGPFQLTDENGRAVTERDFAGRWRVMYFGYTFCPDVCPTDAATIGTALKQVEAADPALGAKIVPLFVTVDPERDTPAVLKQFTAAFHPRMVGLTGSPTALAATEKAFGIYARRGEASPGGGYLMDHSRQVYLMAPDGSPVALLPQEEGADAVAAEIRRWASA